MQLVRERTCEEFDLRGTFFHEDRPKLCDWNIPILGAPFQRVQVFLDTLHECLHTLTVEKEDCRILSTNSACLRFFFGQAALLMSSISKACTSGMGLSGPEGSVQTHVICQRMAWQLTIVHFHIKGKIWLSRPLTHPGTNRMQMLLQWAVFFNVSWNCHLFGASSNSV